MHKQAGVINKEYTYVMIKIDYIDLSAGASQPGPSQGPSTSSRVRYQLMPGFLSDRKKSWYNTGCDEITEADIMIISEWLKSGGPIRDIHDPLHFLKLLLYPDT